MGLPLGGAVHDGSGFFHFSLMSVDPRRVRSLSSRPPGSGPVLYWMSRDQRVAGNWALLRAQVMAVERRAPLAVVFTLTPEFLGAPLRAYDFMLKGLAQVEGRLKGGGDLVSSPVRPARRNASRLRRPAHGGRRGRRLRSASAQTNLENKNSPENCRFLFEEVDAHNIVPAWMVSPKQEYGAYTLRPKLHKLLPDFLTDFPALVRHPFPWHKTVEAVDWDDVLDRLKPDISVGPVKWMDPGESAGARTLGLFIKNRLSSYADGRKRSHGRGPVRPVALPAFRSGVGPESGGGRSGPRLGHPLRPNLFGRTDCSAGTVRQLLSLQFPLRFVCFSRVKCRRCDGTRVI
jgi:hypothetical protein